MKIKLHTRTRFELEQIARAFLDHAGFRTPDDLAMIRDHLIKSNDRRDHLTARVAAEMIKEQEAEDGK